MRKFWFSYAIGLELNLDYIAKVVGFKNRFIDNFIENLCPNVLSFRFIKANYSIVSEKVKLLVSKLLTQKYRKDFSSEKPFCENEDK